MRFPVICLGALALVGCGADEVRVAPDALQGVDLRLVESRAAPTSEGRAGLQTGG